MSVDPPDFFELGPEHELPEDKGDFFELGPEHEIPTHPDVGREAMGRDILIPGYQPQWEARVEVRLPSGEVREQFIRVPRSETDTDQDVREKLLLAQIEIETIVAERGGEYDVSSDITSITEI